jgi:hypothetical protein
VRLSPLGTSATGRPVLPAPGWLRDMEHLVELGLARETIILGENLLQWHFVHHKSYMT